MGYRKYEEIHKEVNGILYKQCRDCEKWIEANTDNFGVNNGVKGGLNARCKECYQKHNHDKYLKNIDTYKENIAKRIANNELYNSAFNNYVIEGDITKIIINTKYGTKISLIDTEDLERVKSFGLRWCIKNSSLPQHQYAKATRWEMVDGEPKLKSYCLHILIMEVKDGGDVDHINHDTLDNRKENLRVVTTSNNVRYRQCKNSNNKSGYRNVCWISNLEQWCVQLHINGKNERLGFFDDVDEAGVFAKEMRQKYYGKFAGTTD